MFVYCFRSDLISIRCARVRPRIYYYVCLVCSLGVSVIMRALFSMMYYYDCVCLSDLLVLCVCVLSRNSYY